MKSAQAAVHTTSVAAEAPDLPDWERNWHRAAEMEKSGVLSKQNADQAQQQYLSAANARDRAVAQITVDAAKERQAQSQVAQAEASLKQLEEQLSYTTITSPIDGVVLSRDVQVGDAVSSILVLGSTATLVMTLGDTHEVYVKGKVDESDIGKVYLGQAARIKVQSFPDRTFYGKVTKIAPLGVEKDNVTTFEVQISIDNPGGELKANMTANAEVVLEEHKHVLTVPEQAVLYDKDRNASVWVPDAAWQGRPPHRECKDRALEWQPRGDYLRPEGWEIPSSCNRRRRIFTATRLSTGRKANTNRRESKALSAMENSMNLRPLLLTAVLSVTTVALADNTFDKTLNVSGQADLYVSTGSGNIHVSAGQRQPDSHRGTCARGMELVW